MIELNQGSPNHKIKSRIEMFVQFQYSEMKSCKIPLQFHIGENLDLIQS